MAIPTAGDKKPTFRRRLGPTYPSLALVMHQFWYFVQLPVRVQPAPGTTFTTIRRSPPSYNPTPQRINLSEEVPADNNWAMRTYDGSHTNNVNRCITPSSATTMNLPSTPRLLPTPGNSTSMISLINLG
ncbi:hypothetical protein SCHPADRAFT_16553 [Schizopora paradoxa]|uniref:Uncharacterized protein n=1 Tax=Schizopora paradoxa TaxID=27342 RepID=A0A0H2SU64_9AGAM|nr:hypothetical protein SCHPADRAFT_16553 [Schizopora paradoxa]